MDPEIQRSLIPAVFGLVGVLVGGGITAGMEWWKLRREQKKSAAKERAAFGKGARLLVAQLRLSRRDVESALETGRLLSRNYSLHDASVWKSYQSVLAAHLDLKLWNALRVGVLTMQSIEKWDFTEPPSASLLERIKARLEEAISVLDPWLELPDEAEVYAPFGTSKLSP